MILKLKTTLILIDLHVSYSNPRTFFNRINVIKLSCTMGFLWDLVNKT